MTQNLRCFSTAVFPYFARDFCMGYDARSRVSGSGIAAGLNERRIPTARRHGMDRDCGLTRIEASYACQMKPPQREKVRRWGPTDLYCVNRSLGGVGERSERGVRATMRSARQRAYYTLV